MDKRIESKDVRAGLSVQVESASLSASSPMFRPVGSL